MPPSEDDAIDKAEFRRRLDATLRQRDPEALRQFLLDFGQWQADTVPADVEASMWMMILASPALGDLHAEAQYWLRGHGRAQEAELLAGKRRPGTAGHHPGGQRQRSDSHGGRQNGRRP